MERSKGIGDINHRHYDFLRLCSLHLTICISQLIFSLLYMLRGICTLWSLGLTLTFSVVLLAFALGRDQLQVHMGSLVSKSGSAGTKPKSTELPDPELEYKTYADMPGAREADLVLDRVKAALWGAFIGDALAMPAHWYYNLSQLKQDHGQITYYTDPPKRFPGSIMNLSNTGGGGRGSDEGTIVGEVILHGKRQYWMRGGSYHYHHTLKAGENTLEARLMQLVLDSMTDSKGTVNSNQILERYMTFMTTPDSHNDVYASTCHRMFFANIVNGVKPELAPDNDGHNVDTIDSLTMPIPAYLAGLVLEKQKAASMGFEVMELTRRTTTMEPFNEVYAQMLSDALDGKSAKEIAQNAGQRFGMNVQREVDSGGRNLMTACYISSSFPTMLYFLYKFGDDLEQCLIASVNAGGENVARSTNMGAILGAIHGIKGIPAKFINGLKARESIEDSVTKFITVLKEQEEKSAL